MEKIEKENKFYLLVHNISKPKNVGMILRSAAAFKVEKIFLIKKNDNNLKKSKIMKQFNLFFGSKGTAERLSYYVFESIKKAKEYFNDNLIDIVGIEIGENSKDVRKEEFKRDTVFIPGNEGAGLIQPLKNICDYLVYIPQFTNKVASLNVSIATSIVFNHFSHWAKYKEVKMIEEKFRENKKPEKKFLDFEFHEKPNLNEKNDLSKKIDLEKTNLNKKVDLSKKIDLEKTNMNKKIDLEKNDLKKTNLIKKVDLDKKI